MLPPLPWLHRLDHRFRLACTLLFGLVISTPYLHHTQAPARRLSRITIGLIAIVTAANFAAEGLLLHYLLEGGGRGGRTLVFSAARIWLTNVAVFGLWFWEVDRVVPHRRGRRRSRGQHPQHLMHRG
jgi:hypothetical protein